MDDLALDLLLRHCQSSDKPTLLSNLGVRLRKHFECHGELDILQRSIARLEAANRLTLMGHPEKPVRLVDLGISLRTRFDHLGQLQDLQGACTLHRLAVYITSHRPLDKAYVITEFANTLLTRFQRLGELDDLRSAITMQHIALEQTPEGSPERPKLLFSLAVSLMERFQHLGALDDLERAISVQQAVIELTCKEHPDYPMRLHGLGASLGTRFQQLGRLDDLESSISFYERSVQLTPPGDSGKPARLGGLAASHGDRFQRYGKLYDLKRAIDVGHLALELTPEGNPDKPKRLGNLAIFLKDRYKRFGNIDDLERATYAFRHALELTPDGHPDKQVRLANLAASFGDRYRVHGELNHLEDAIKVEQLALDLTPDGHPDRPGRLASLAVLFVDRFRRLDILRDLERAIASHQLAVELTPEGHPDKPARLGGLAVSLSDRYRRLGELKDLEHGKNAEQLALDLTPEEHPDKPARFASLAMSLVYCFRHLGEFESLERAIAYNQRAIELTADEHPEKPWRLINLAVSLGDRYQRLGKLEDLEGAIAFHQRAIKLTPDGHPDGPARLASLALSLVERFRRFGELENLEHAIILNHRAVELTPEGHPEKADRLSGLVISLRDRYGRLGKDQDLQCAIVFQKQALELTPEGNPDKVWRLYNLGMLCKDLFQIQQSKSRFDITLDCFMEAAMQSLGHPSIRLCSAQQCVLLLSKYTEFGSAETLLLAHSRIIQVIPEIVWVGHSIDRRFQESAKLGSLVNDAASAFIQARSRYQAIEWMEMGRSLVWSQILSLRAPLDERLRKEHSDLALALDKILGELRGSLSSMTHHSPSQDLQRSYGIVPPTPPNGPTFDSSSHPTAVDRHRQLVIQFEILLKEIRNHTGFENFMRLPGLKSLFPLIEHFDGPVVFINVHSSSCDALALFPNGAIRHVVLPDLSETRARNLRSTWIRCLQSSNTRIVRGAASLDKLVHRDRTTAFGLVLRHLWMWIVHPIFQALDLMNLPSSYPLPHITWCPTGPLTQLPLHAAGIYDGTKADRSRAFDLAVSSYTPSLSALLRCREGSSASLATQPGVLVVAQPETPGLSPLPGSHEECTRIQALLPESNFLKHEQATVAGTLHAMRQHAWLHLACHGAQDTTNPTQSAFALYDGRLTLSALMGTVADNAELAFLSACETAVGDEKIPEESAHLAAGMLAVGFKGIIATMWSIRDADAPIIVEAYYRKLLELRSSGEMVAPGYTGAAYALHEAAEVLRDHVGEQNFMQWGTVNYKMLRLPFLTFTRVAFPFRRPTMGHGLYHARVLY